MSPSYGEDAVGIHFTWKSYPEAVEAMLVQLETALVPFVARLHWDKLVDVDAAIVLLYERLLDFIGLVRRLDPRRVFRDPWLEARAR